MTKALSKLTRLIEEFRRLDPEMPAHHALVLVMVAGDEGTPQIKVAGALGMSKSTTQRIFDKLSDRGTGGRDGLGLIDVRRGRLDARETEAYLTPKGKRFMETLSFIVEA